MNTNVVKCRFYDIQANWNRVFRPYLKHPDFLQALYVYRQWHPKKYYPDGSGDANVPLIYCGLDPNNLTPEQEEILRRQRESQVTSQDPLWYVVPHGCGDLNNVVMATLMNLAFPPQKQVYSLCLTMPDRSWDYHYLETRADLPVNSILEFDYSRIPDENAVVLYDLYYPLMSYFGFRYDDYSTPLSSMNLRDKYTMAECWSSTKYNYDCVGKIPEELYQEYLQDSPDSLEDVN